VNAILTTAELAVVPDPEDPMNFDVVDSTSHLLDGIPKTPAQPWVIDHDDTQNVFFINQGVGLMTVDLSRAIPPPPIAQISITAPQDLVLQSSPTVSVAGEVKSQDVRRLLVNGFEVALPPVPPNSQPRRWSITIPLHEGVNPVLASGIDGNGAPLGQAGIQVLRSFATNPFAGPGTINVSLPPLSGTAAATSTVVATVANVRKFDALYVNGQLVSEKRCPVGTLRSRSACGWSGVGNATIPLAPRGNAIFATAVDFDSEDVDGPGSFFDLDVEEGIAFAVKKDLFVFDAASLALLATLEIPTDDAFRISVARQVMTDLDDDDRDALAENGDGDAITVFQERKNLALVAGGTSGRLTFVDVTEPHRPAVLGWLDTGAGAYRAVAVPDRGIAYLTTGSGIQVIDLTHPNQQGLWDLDGDGVDDRILADVPVAGAQDLRVDLDKGLAYVLQKGQGLAVVRLDSCDTDIGVDATRQQTPRRSRFANAQQERAALLAGIENGRKRAACEPFRADFALLAQGSSACICASARRRTSPASRTTTSSSSCPRRSRPRPNPARSRSRRRSRRSTASTASISPSSPKHASSSQRATAKSIPAAPTNRVIPSAEPATTSTATSVWAARASS